MLQERIHAQIAWLLFLAVTLAYAVMAWRYPMAHSWATHEDLYGEWTQTFLFLAAFELRPTSSRYRKMYLRFRSRFGE